MRLIVQIPCFNEEETLPSAIAGIPRRIEGVDEIDILIIDDGSTDRTVEIARKCGVDHIVSHKRNMGLAAAFRTGLDACLFREADIIVNTDGDNQYDGADIPRLIRPILDSRADIVIGDRRPAVNPHFSNWKKALQVIGSFVVRMASGADVPDTVSGFRAFSRKAALQLNVVSSFSYTIETIVQARHKRLSVVSVPISTNAKTRESRLFRNIPQFVSSSAATLLRVYAMYHPLRVFFCIGSVVALGGVIPIVRFLYFYASGVGHGHVQSLILGGVLIVLSGLIMLAGLIADLIASNRKLIETTLEKVRRLELQQARQNKQSDDESNPVSAFGWDRVSERRPPTSSHAE
jgi:glycosyltransferase involved in cell wall biosynthesis